MDDAIEYRDGKSFLENEADTQIPRTRAAHREIVHGAVDGEATDVAAGKEQGTDDVRVGGEGEACAGERCGERGAVVARGEGGIVERGREEAVDQLLGEFSAATVREENFRRAVRRSRARKRRRFGHGARVPVCGRRNKRGGADVCAADAAQRAAY